MNWGVALIGWIWLVALTAVTWGALSDSAWGVALAFDAIMIPCGIFAVVALWEP